MTGPTGAARVAGAMNRAFAGDPERVPMVPEEVWEATRAPGFAPGASFALFQGDRRGDDPAGFSLCFLSPDGRGLIDTLGVVPAHRGQGLGFGLTCLSRDALAALGATSVELAVAQDNEPALRTYRKAGFEIVSCTATYARTLD